jgi:hypothetical protein
MIYGESASFDALIEQLAELQNRIRAIKWDLTKSGNSAILPNLTI